MAVNASSGSFSAETRLFRLDGEGAMSSLQVEGWAAREGGGRPAGPAGQLGRAREGGRLGQKVKQRGKEKKEVFLFLKSIF